MGKAARVKRARREVTEFVSSLTACEGTWLERMPDKDEQNRVNEARRELSLYRPVAAALVADEEAVMRLSLEVLRDPRFAPLYFEDWLIEQVIATHGEPPVVENEEDPAFSDYLRAAVQSSASSKVRRAMAGQVARFMPQLLAENKYREAISIEYNIYLTLMSDAVTPLLAQMMVGGLARYYDEHEEEEAPSAT